LYTLELEIEEDGILYGAALLKADRAINKGYDVTRDYDDSIYSSGLVVHKDIQDVESAEELSIRYRLELGLKLIAQDNPNAFGFLG
jgi:hypothetical protein